MGSNSFRLSILGLVFVSVGCGQNGGGLATEGSGGSQGGAPAAGGSPGSGGHSSSSGGVTGSGGTVSASGGTVGTGGTQATGGVKASGGTVSSGGVASTGGVAGGGAGGQSVVRPDAGAPLGGAITGQGGRGTGGVTIPGSGGRTGAGGAATGGTTSTGTGTSAVNCSATMPSGGTDHCGQNTQGKAGDLSWSLWSNAINSNGCITTFSTTAFSARWNNNGDFLARLGLEFGNSSKTYDQYGTLKADYSYTKTGSGGGYSYIGIYGWTNNPCVEWYIVDDRYGTMPFNAYNAAQKGSATIDGEVYKLFQNKTTGTGGSRCSGVNEWDQYWSIRQKARQCGTITISEHFKAWEAAGLKMGGLLEAKILVETGGGQGSIEFPVANVTAQ